MESRADLNLLQKKFFYVATYMNFHFIAIYEWLCAIHLSCTNRQFLSDFLFHSYTIVSYLLFALTNSCQIVKISWGAQIYISKSIWRSHKTCVLNISINGSHCHNLFHGSKASKRSGQYSSNTRVLPHLYVKICSLVVLNKTRESVGLSSNANINLQSFLSLKSSTIM